MNDLSHLKAKGIIPQKQNGYFTLRFLSRAGYFSAEELQALSTLATTFGDGRVGLTSRLTIELNYIHQENLDKALDFAASHNLRIGGGGSTVRAVLTCKGSVCSHGLADTESLTNAIEAKFFGRELPGKFKIAVLGCRNSYGKALGNDLSILAIKPLTVERSQCIGCKKCLQICPDQALTLEGTTLQWNAKQCTHCGQCIPVCPTHVFQAEECGFLVFIGGRFGRHARLATPLPGVFKEDELFELIENILTCYSTHAKPKERFAEVIERIGIKKIEVECLNS